VPIDLLDWLDGIDCLHVCDACQSNAPPGTLHRWEYSAATPAHPNRECGASRPAVLAGLRSTGSHDFGLATVLELANRLGCLPLQVVVWGIEGRRFEIGVKLSPEMIGIVPEVAAAVAGALRQA